MPKIKSAKKALKQSEKRRIRNLRKKRAVKVAVKDIYKSLQEKNNEAAKKHLQVAFKQIDKASKTFMHKNKANRMKSRLSKKLNKSLK